MITITISGTSGTGKSLAAWAIKRAFNIMGLAEAHIVDETEFHAPSGTGASDDAMYQRWARWARESNLTHHGAHIVAQAAPSVGTAQEINKCR